MGVVAIYILRTPCESAVSGTFAAEVLPQVYRAICSNTLKHRWLRELRRFTCEGGWRAHRSEKAFSGTFAAEVLPQVYREIYRNALKHRGLRELRRFTCGGGKRAHRSEKAFWGALPAGGPSQVYRAICDNTLRYSILRELRRFTCGRVGSPAKNIANPTPLREVHLVLYPERKRQSGGRRGLRREAENRESRPPRATGIRETERADTGTARMGTAKQVSAPTAVLVHPHWKDGMYLEGGSSENVLWNVWECSRHLSEKFVIFA